MSYEFAGFFAQAEPPVLEDALATWSVCRGRTITEPFHGIGVVVPERALTYGKPRNRFPPSSPGAVGSSRRSYP
jgi:hypothetical protein